MFHFSAYASNVCTLFRCVSGWVFQAFPLQIPIFGPHQTQILETFTLLLILIYLQNVLRWFTCIFLDSGIPGGLRKLHSSAVDVSFQSCKVGLPPERSLEQADHDDNNYTYLRVTRSFLSTEDRKPIFSNSRNPKRSAGVHSISEVTGVLV